jgi:predicted dinucleotide-binding enzyme
MQRSDHLQSEACAHHDRLAIALAGDDFSALAVAKQLVFDAGFEPVIVGSLDEGRAFDPGTPYYGSGIRAPALRQSLAEVEAETRDPISGSRREAPSVTR